MTNTVETNEELIARARELCEREIKEWQRTVTFLGGSKDNHAENQLNSWTTHLAEMGEHKAVEHCKSPLCHGPVCAVCRKVSTLGEIQTASPCDFLVAKAKRLLGVE